MLFKTVHAFSKLAMILICNFTIKQALSIFLFPGHLRINILWKEIMWAFLSNVFALYALQREKKILKKYRHSSMILGCL